MKKIIIIIIVMGMFGWSVYEFYDASEKDDIPDESTGLSDGQIPPDFELETLEGETIRLSDYRGERVIINFWATWCPPCRAEMPDFQKLYEEEDVEILAVNLTASEESLEKVSGFVDELGLTFPILLDTESQVESNYQIQAYPTSYMVDSNGKIQFVARGAINHDIMKRELSKME